MPVGLLRGFVVVGRGAFLSAVGAGRRTGGPGRAGTTDAASTGIAAFGGSLVGGAGMSRRRSGTGVATGGGDATDAGGFGALPVRASVTPAASTAAPTAAPPATTSVDTL